MYGLLLHQTTRKMLHVIEINKFLVHYTNTILLFGLKNLKGSFLNERSIYLLSTSDNAFHTFTTYSTHPPPFKMRFLPASNFTLGMYLYKDRVKNDRIHFWYSFSFIWQTELENSNQHSIPLVLGYAKRENIWMVSY